METFRVPYLVFADLSAILIGLLGIALALLLIGIVALIGEADKIQKWIHAR